MNTTTKARFRVHKTPHFRVLSDAQTGDIYAAACEILQRTGSDVHSEEARDILKQGGCWVDGARVRIPIGLSEWAVRTAPSTILLYDRNGTKKLSLGERRTYFGPGPTNTYHIDPDTEERRKPTLQDTQNVAKVCDALPNIDFVQDLGTPGGVTPTLADVHIFSTLVRNTTKPIVHWGFDIDQYQDIVDIAAAVVGGLDNLQKRPFIALYSESSPPLVHSEEAIAKAIFAARNRIPIVYTPCIISGATAPATLAGALAMGVAESLVGIVVSQLIREGSPIIMGGVYGIMDMATTIYSYGSPEFLLMQAGIAEVAHHMKMPVFGTAGCTDSHTLDAQAAAEAAMSILIAAEAGANLVHDCGYTAFGSAGSVFQLVMADEIIGMVKRIMQGIEMNDDTLALDVIDNAGPGGEFITSKHTYKYFKQQTWFPTLINRMRYSEWKMMTNESSMGQRVKEKARQIIHDHQVPPLSEDVIQKIDAILQNAEAREQQKAAANKKQ
ncbi:trimethylamine methyltransferase [candidate division KSB3 bacterium]|uniref:Trimethylamine methyltransferase n=1 Tax=candidate division KSB3 bacterium TaxID=2044937 RepID=A0A9D5JTH8_9BACT|nr:trimethylamine methyltransferase [candidate division KSB3 bacterium]MBD3323958.1 trimethylamine methyltransferase [candidate division KSB3 bacterium]